MSGPNAFSMRRAISGVSAALPCRRSESVARRTFKISAAFDTLRPRAWMISVLIRTPGWGGIFMGVSAYLVVVEQDNRPGGVRAFVERKINRQLPLTVRLHTPLSSPFNGRRFPPE